MPGVRPRWKCRKTHRALRAFISATKRKDDDEDDEDEVEVAENGDLLDKRKEAEEELDEENTAVLTLAYLPRNAL